MEAQADKESLCLYGIELLGIGCMIASLPHDTKMAPKHKKDKPLKNSTKCRENTRIITEKTYLMIRICIVELLYFTECKAHTFYLAWPSSGTPERCEGKGGGGRFS
jgi:hypothetical protein